MAEYKLSYTASQINERLGKVDTIPTKTSQLTNDSGFLTSIPSEYVTETELTSALDGTKPFIINLTVDETSTSSEQIQSRAAIAPTFVADKTFEQITDAFENRCTLICYVPTMGAILPFSYYTAIFNSFVFGSTVLSGSDLDVIEIVISSDNTVEYHTKSYPALPEATVSSAPKTLIGELNLNSNSLTATSTTGIYNLDTASQTVMRNVCSRLDEGFDILIVETNVLDNTTQTTGYYNSGSNTLSFYRGVSTVNSSIANSSKIMQNDFLETTVRTNQSALFSQLLSSGATFNVKFYIGFGSSSESCLPSVSSTDNGKVLMVSDGLWTAVTIPSAEGVGF